MMHITPLTNNVFIGSQIHAEDIAELKKHNITAVINNRPDSEDPNQPTNQDISLLMQQHHLLYYHIPISGTNVSLEDMHQLVTILNSATGPVFLYCRSGTRSSLLWALTASRYGLSTPQSIIKICLEAGYNFQPFQGIFQKHYQWFLTGI